jgi:transcriptional regulator with XRE-family HTH domain
MNSKRRVEYKWDAESIHALRQYMGWSQQQMSDELGVRQQTVSEWEIGMYQPRGGMCTLLSLVAERVGFPGPEAVDEPQSIIDWAHQPIGRLELKPRALNSLRQAGLYEVGQVINLWRQGKERFLEIPGFGARSLDALEKKLYEHRLIY